MKENKSVVPIFSIIITFFAVLVSFVQPAFAATYYENNGLLVVEAESGTLHRPNGAHTNWVKKQTLTGYTGSGYELYTVDGVEPTSVTSPSQLVYDFYIKDPGQYQLAVRMQGNDGGATSVAGVRVGFDNGTGRELIAPGTGWVWATHNLDPDSGVAVLFTATFATAATHTMVVMPEQAGITIDRLVLYKDTVVDPKAPIQAESPTKASTEVQPAASNASTCTNIYKSGAGIPDGFGAPYNVLTSQRELLMTIACSGDTYHLSVGTGDPNQYIYKYGYSYDGTKWVQYSLTSSSTLVNDTWYTGRATASVSKSVMQNYIVAYMCLWNGTAWKCGCRDSSCAHGLWQLQGVQ